MTGRYLRLSAAALLMASLMLFIACDSEVDPGNDTGGTDDTRKYVPDYYGTLENASDAPSVSPAGGVFTAAVTITAECAEGNVLRYTENCELPNGESAVFPGTLEVSAGEDGEYGASVRVLRFAEFDTYGKQVGGVLTASYIFPSEENRFTTEIVSLVSDPDYLYGYENGIMVAGRMADLYAAGETYIMANYNGRGREWERPASFSYYDRDGVLLFAQDVGIRVSGTGSRGEEQKSFRVFARKEYSPAEGKLNYPFFEGLTGAFTGNRLTEFDTLLLRSAASNTGNTLITNAVCCELLQDCEALSTQRFKPVCVFLNGEYYGFMMLSEDYDPVYFENHYGVDPEFVATVNLSVVQNEERPYIAWELDDGPSSEYEEFNRVCRWISGNNMVNAEKYSQACKYIDIDNFIEYLIAECYLNNWDWPRNNIRIWRCYKNGYMPEAEPGADGRWRFVVKDSDITMNTLVSVSKGFHSDITTDFFRVVEKDGGYLTGMMNSLMKNSSFKSAFIDRFLQFSAETGSPARLLDEITDLQVTVSAEAVYNNSRFGPSLGIWDSHIERMRMFADARQSNVVVDVEERLGVDFTAITLPAYENGTLFLNGVPIDAGGEMYYTTLGRVLTFSAVPAPGYRFNGFSVNGAYFSIDETAGTLSLIQKRGVLTPVFVANGGEPRQGGANGGASAGGVVINEVGFGSRDAVGGCDWVELYNPTADTVSLEGWILTDGINSHTLDGLKLDAGAFTVIRLGEGGDADFGLSRGELVTLTHKDGESADSVLLETGAGSGKHIGRYPDGGELHELTVAELTPGMANRFTENYYVSADESITGGYLFLGKPVAADYFTDGNITLAQASELLGDSAEVRRFLASLDASFRGGSGMPVGEFFADYSERVGRVYHCRTTGTTVVSLNYAE